MGAPEGSGAPRDYFAGSVAVLFLRRLVEGSTQVAERLSKRAAAQAIQSDPFRATCAFLASALLANGLALWWAHRGATPWGIALRLALLCTALLGLACRGGWPAVRETAVLIRLVRFFRLQGWEQRVRVISACRVCGNPELRPVIDLGPQSLAGLFDDGRPQNQLATPIPLEVLRCDTARGRGGCGFVQLKHTVPPDIMFQDYGYRSGLNERMRRHLEELSREIESHLKLQAGDIVLDIGANDGTTLLAYRTPGLVRVGFEPSNAAAEAQARGVQILKGSAGEALFFDSEGGARDFERGYPGRKAKVITTVAMFYDVEDPAGFCRQVHRILDEEGLWVIELHYWGSLLETTAFDAICHEHLGYYSLATLEWLFRSTGFELFDLSFNPSNGGSIRCYLVKQRGRVSPLKEGRRRVAEGLDRERQRGYDTAQSHARLRQGALKIRHDLRQVLGEAARSGARVYGYGASTKGNVLLQYCGLGPADLVAIADRNPMKRGRFTPGSRIPICAEEEMREDHPDLLLILPWHFLDGFLEREKGLRAAGTRFIVPFPQVRIV